MYENIDNLVNFKYIYLPYKNGSLNVNNGDYIYKEDIIINNNKKIYSPVSGNVLGLTTINNKKYIVIENDYKEKTKIRKGTKKYINKYSKEELLNLIQEYLVIDNFDINSKVLIISGLDEYIDEITYNTLIKEYTIEILDTIDALIDIMNIKKCFFAVNSNDTELVDILFNNMGTYPKIDLKLFNNNHYISNKSFLINKLTNYKNKKYNLQYLNIKDILNIYNVLKKNRYSTETYITLTGDLLNYTKVIRVKIGSNLKDILDEYNIKNYKNVIVNGLLNGIHLKDINFIIDKNTRSIFINNLNKEIEHDCINCGLCVTICPVEVNPKYMYFNKDKKSLIYKEKCIDCGICAYLCPSKINLNKGVKK